MSSWYQKPFGWAFSAGYSLLECLPFITNGMYGCINFSTCQILSGPQFCLIFFNWLIYFQAFTSRLFLIVYSASFILNISRMFFHVFVVNFAGFVFKSIDLADTIFSFQSREPSEGPVSDGLIYFCSDDIFPCFDYLKTSCKTHWKSFLLFTSFLNTHMASVSRLKLSLWWIRPFYEVIVGVPGTKLFSDTAFHRPLFIYSTCFSSSLFKCIFSLKYMWSFSPFFLSPNFSRRFYSKLFVPSSILIWNFGVCEALSVIFYSFYSRFLFLLCANKANSLEILYVYSSFFFGLTLSNSLHRSILLWARFWNDSWIFTFKLNSEFLLLIFLYVYGGYLFSSALRIDGKSMLTLSLLCLPKLMGEASKKPSLLSFDLFRIVDIFMGVLDMVGIWILLVVILEADFCMYQLDFTDCLDNSVFILTCLKLCEGMLWRRVDVFGRCRSCGV